MPMSSPHLFLQRQAAVLLTAFGCLLLVGSVSPTPTRALESFQDIVLITHPDVALRNWSKSELQDILLGKTTVWKAGNKVILFDLNNDDLHGKFTESFTGKTASQYEIYWKKRVFTGKGKAPRRFLTEKRMVDYIAKTPGAIGYISRKVSRDSEIIIDPKSKQARVQIIVRK
ncbi:MAG: ABC-type phosphate transport system substrate-binding protein [Planctomycetota bacterium]|jgi:ABC-type phosphate transport system substrate-binding protein